MILTGVGLMQLNVENHLFNPVAGISLPVFILINYRTLQNRDQRSKR